MIVKNESTKTYSVIIPIDENNEKNVLSRSNIKTKQEARDYELSVTDFKKKGNNDNVSHKKYFDDLLEAFTEDKRLRVRLSTFVSYDVLMTRFIKPAFSGKKLDEITPADVRTWQNAMMKLDYSPQYLRKVDSLLSSVFKYGVRFFGMKVNPSKLAGSIGNYSSKKVDFWTLEEFTEFIKYVKDQRLHLIYDILYWTGMRIGEVLALTPQDIDLAEQTIQVDKTFKRYHKKDIISPPKTKKSNRKVFINKGLTEEIRDYLTLNRQIGTDERMFTLSFDSVRDRLERTARKAGVKRIKIHDLRHSHASLLISMNITPLMVSERLGHEKVETTLNIYSHLYPDMQRKLTDALDSKFEMSCLKDI